MLLLVYEQFSYCGFLKRPHVVILLDYVYFDVIQCVPLFLDELGAVSKTIRATTAVLIA